LVYDQRVAWPGNCRWRHGLPAVSWVLVLFCLLSAGLASAGGPITIASRVCTDTNTKPPSDADLRICAYLTSPKETLEVVSTHPDGELVLHSPFTGVDVTHGAPGCGLSEGHPCVVNHYDWTSPNGGIFDTAGCGQNEPTCTVKLPTGSPAWTILRVELDDNDLDNEIAFVVTNQPDTCEVTGGPTRSLASAGGVYFLGESGATCPNWSMTLRWTGQEVQLVTWKFPYKCGGTTTLTAKGGAGDTGAINNATGRFFIGMAKSGQFKAHISGSLKPGKHGQTIVVNSAEVALDASPAGCPSGAKLSGTLVLQKS
jgi:hypothetical protein